MTRRIDGLHNRVFFEPLFRGTYADDLAADTEGLPFQGRPWQDWVLEGDLEVISAPLDVLARDFARDPLALA